MAESVAALHRLMEAVETLMIAPKEDRDRACTALKVAFEACDDRTLSDGERRIKARWLASFERMSCHTPAPDIHVR